MLTLKDFEAWGVEHDPKIAEMIGDVLAQAAIVAPCLSEPDFPYAAAAKAILREAVLRRFEAGPGGVTTRQQGTGPFSQSETVDTRMQRGILQPRDIVSLEQLCKAYRGESAARAGSLNLDPGAGRAAPAVHPFLIGG